MVLKRQDRQQNFLNSFRKKLDCFGFHACSVPLTMIHRKHRGREILIGRVVAWERMAVQLRHWTAALAVTALTATERQAINLVCIKLGSSTPSTSFKVNVDVMQSLLPCHAFFGLNTLIRVPWNDEEDFPFSYHLFRSIVVVKDVVSHFEPTS